MPPPSAAFATSASGALFLDDADAILLVRPTYKPYWDIPGGYLEPGESPRAACVRELHEELGLPLDVGSLLVIDWILHPTDGDKYLFVFAGPRLTPAEHAAIRLQTDELSEYRYVPVDELGDYTIDRLVDRLTEAHRAFLTNRTTYLENGVPTS